MYHWYYGYLPGGGQFRGWEEVTDHHRRLPRLLTQLPPDAALSAHDRLNPHVSGRETLYIFDRLADADYIALDVTEDSWPLHPVELRNQVNEFLRREWGVVDAFDGYLLLAKNPPASLEADLAPAPTELPDEFYDFARVRVPNPATFQPDYPAEVVFDNKLKLLGYDLEYGAHEARLSVVTLYWQALEPLAKDYNLWPFFVDRRGRLIEDTSQRPLVATLWYPTSRWQPGEIIATRTLPWDLGGEFTLAVGVVEEAKTRGGEEAEAGGGEETKTRGGEGAEDLVGWANTEQRLKITAADESLPLYEQQTWARLGTFERVGPQTYAPVTPLANPPSQPRQVTFWNLLTLQGVDLPTESLRPGESLPFTLHWQSAVPMTVDLKTFAHLLDAQGNMVAQLDWTPQDSLGYRPTTSWRPGQPVVDRQAIPLPPDLPPGPYRLVVGWYYPVTGQRLPVTASDTGKNGDSMRVGEVRVE
jgi:hypothetical protein